MNNAEERLIFILEWRLELREVRQLIGVSGKRYMLHESYFEKPSVIVKNVLSLARISST